MFFNKILQKKISALSSNREETATDANEWLVESSVPTEGHQNMPP